MLRASGTPDMREPMTVASGKQETAAQRGKGWGGHQHCWYLSLEVLAHV